MANPFGAIFGEELQRGRKPKKNLNLDPSSKLSENNGWILILVFVAGFGLLVSRLFGVTVIEGERFRKLSQENRIREEKLPSPRGIVYDRSGTALLRNIPYFVSAGGVKYFEQMPSTVSGVIKEGIARQYIYGDLFSHVLGYTGEISEEEIKSQKEDGSKLLYKPGDIVGKTGVEKEKDVLLRGVDGKELYEVDAVGIKSRVLGKVEPLSGKNLTLTLDLSLQKKAAEILAGKKGAVIATDPRNGEILALFSSPSFDPNNFIRGENLENIFTDSQRPVFNRAIAGLYPPGSTFKIVTSLAALEAGAITADTKIEDTGILTVGEFSFGNWYFLQHGKKEGFLDIVGAIKRSNDIFFYQIGNEIGIEKLASFAGEKMGFGKRSGIDVGGEAEGLMPDPNWRRQVKGEDWYLGNTYHVAIGQGDVLATPLDVNAWTNIIANSGKLCRPHVAKGQSECRDLKLQKENLDLVREGMRQACDTGGTGWPLFKFKVKSEKLKVDGVDFLEPAESTTSAKFWVSLPVACKTGTAEFGDPKGRTHAWFTVFAPLHNPEISITVLVEEGGEGSSVAAPLAKKLLEEWFGK